MADDVRQNRYEMKESDEKRTVPGCASRTRHIVSGDKQKLRLIVGAFWSLLVRDGLGESVSKLHTRHICSQTYLLLSHSRNDGNQQLFAVIEIGLNLLAKIILGDLHIVFGNAVRIHEVEETVVDVDLRGSRAINTACVISGYTYELVFIAADMGNIHVMGRRTDIFL
jgi:hypothetical protein